MKKLAVAGVGIVALLLSGGPVWAGHRCHCRPVRCHKVKHVHTCHTHAHAADCGSKVELDCGHRVRQYCHRRTSHLCLRRLFGSCRREVSRCHHRNHCQHAVEYAPPSEGTEVPAPPAEEVPAPPAEEVPAPPADKEAPAPAPPAATPDAPPAPAP